MSFRVSSQNARRGGLVIVGAGAEDGPRLARLYADGGYETVVGEDGDDSGTLIGQLAPPVFVLAFPDAAPTAWSLTGAAAVSLVADARVSDKVAELPAVPAILHLNPDTHAALAGAFEAARPELPIHLRLSTADGERLLFLRTLRLFSANAGGRGEV